jgi:hypothetical protein
MVAFDVLNSSRVKNWTKIFFKEKKSGREGGGKHQFKSQLIPQNQSVRRWIIISGELNESHLFNYNKIPSSELPREAKI